jgi:nucleotide-binding universal stress UspA family protein
MFYDPKVISGVRINDGIAPVEEQASHSRTLVRSGGIGSDAAHRTLIPVDESKDASNAIEYVIRAVQNGSTSEIHLINVQPLVMQGDFVLNEIVQIEKRAQLAVGEQVIERARRLLGKNGIACEAAVRFGRPATTIVQYAREQCIDAIVMGMRSRSLVSRLLRRSVAADVARMADVPVIILKTHDGLGITVQGNPLHRLRPVAMQ